MNSKLTKFSLAFVVIVGFLAVTGIPIFIPSGIPETWQSTFDKLIGAWITNFAIVISYFFGSSSGSAEKTSIISRNNGGKK